MMPQDPTVGGIVLRRPAIRSPNYVQGSTGWTINVDGSAEFNNLTIRGTFAGTDFIINSSGAFFYSPSPGAGNLIASIASSSGTDQYGNTYQAGIAVYTGSLVAQLLAGALFLNDALGTDWAVSAFVNNGTTPYLGFSNVANDVVAFMDQFGHLLASEPGSVNTPESWHTLPLASGWTSVVGPFYRATNDDMVEVFGSATHAAFTTTTQLSTTGALGAGYQPARTWNLGGTGIPGRAGAEATAAGTILAVANGTSCTECDIAGRFPLGL